MKIKNRFFIGIVIFAGFLLQSCDIQPASISMDCVSTSVSGSYVAGTALNGNNKITLEVTVEEPGIFELATVQSNGYFFSKNGRIDEVGTHIIELDGFGSPDQAGMDSVSFVSNTINQVSCPITIDVAGSENSEKVIIVTGEDQSNFNYYVYAINQNGGLRWQIPGVADIPAVSNGKVYLNLGETLKALNLTDGSEVWSLNASDVTLGNNFNGSVTIHDEILYVTGALGDLIAINAADGSYIWTFQSDHKYSGYAVAATVVRNTIFYSSFSSGDAKVYAINLDGSLKWKMDFPSTIRSSMAVAPAGTLFIGSDDGNLTAVAIDPDTFNLQGVLWTYDAGISGQEAPALAQGKVVIHGDDGGVTCLDQITGNVIWNNPGSNGWSSPLIIGDTVYALGTNSHRITALDLLTGNTDWNYGQYFGSDESVSHLDGVIYYAASGGAGLYARNAETGEFLWKFGAYSVSPWNIEEGIVFISSPVITTIDGASVGYPSESGNRQ